MRITLLDSILIFFLLQFPNSQSRNHTLETSICFTIVRLALEMKTYISYILLTLKTLDFDVTVKQPNGSQKQNVALCVFGMGKTAQILSFM